MRRRFLVPVGLLVVLGGCLAAWSFHRRISAEQQLAREIQLAGEEAERIRSQVILFTERSIPPGFFFGDFLGRLGFAGAAVSRILEQTRPVYDLRRVRAANRLAVGRSVTGELRAVRYQIDADREVWISLQGPEARAELRTIPSTTHVVAVTGKVHDSLFNAVSDAGEGPELALQLADIFGWDLDFYTDPRRGDTFCLVVEKKTYRNGQAARYGRIFAAEYNNAGDPFLAVLFREPSGQPAYYAPDGNSLKKAFLRSPLKFSAPITSHYSRSRLHPVLKRHRPHLGTDYRAPIGTPVQTIGDGRVLFAGAKGSNGRMVHIRHANGYETMYLHLSRLYVRPGERVAQGERIGLVGSTGLSTGPHLDFRIRQHGAYRNFESLRLPPAQPVARADWPEFVAARDQWLARLPKTDPGRADSR